MDRSVSSFGLAGCLSFERPGAILEGNSKIFSGCFAAVLRRGVDEGYVSARLRAPRESRCSRTEAKKGTSFVTEARKRRG